MSRIKPMTEEGWRAVAEQVQVCRNANSDLMKMISGHVPAKRIDQAIKIERHIAKLQSDLEDEVFRRGGPRDIHIFYPKPATEE